MLSLFGFIACEKNTINPEQININDLHESTLYAPLILDLSSYNKNSYDFKINGDKIEITDKEYKINDAGFYILEVISLSNLNDIDSLVFVLLDQKRGEAEWGLKKWTPKQLNINIYNDQDIDIIYPKNYVNGLNLPVCFKIYDDDMLKQHYQVNYNNNVDFNIKYGIGSCNIPEIVDEQLNFRINDRAVDVQVNMVDGWEYLPEIISHNTTISEGSRIRIKTTTTINTDVTLTIQPGAIITVEEGVNIINNGTLKIVGNKQDPVVITSAENGSYWGGFISNGGGSYFEIEYAFFCYSGYHDSETYAYGHAKRQALFYLHKTDIEIDNCYILDNIGQVFYSISSNLNISNVIIQRAKTAGQLNASYAKISNSFFADFPNDDTVYIDEDNDCLYLTGTSADIDSTYFIFAKDDGIDSGGSGGGIITISNCIFASIFHEGLALSSEVGTDHIINNCYFTNCGQGVELGYSNKEHKVVVNSCLFEYNNVGIRYGDNYNGEVNGILKVNDTYSINNYDKDIWNFVRKEWRPKVDNMMFNNCVVSKYSKDYPDLIVL